MPQVPYNPVPSVSPIGGGTPRFSPAVPSEAFGDTVAKAVSTLGAVQAKVGDELFNRAIAMQELANQTEAKEAESRYIIESGQMRADYGALLGKNAVDAYPKYMQDLKTVRERIRDGLSNDASKRLYDGPSMNTMSYTIANGAGHAASENKKWAIGAASARIETYQTRALNNPEDDMVFQRNLTGAATEVKSISDLNGWSEEKTAHTAKTVASDLWLKRITGLSKDEPWKAQQMLDEAKSRGDIQGEDIAKADHAVKQSIYQIGSRTVTQEIIDDDPERKKPLGELIAEGEAKAKKLMPDDPIFKDYVSQRISAEWSMKERAKRVDDSNNRQTITAGLIGGYGAKGDLPTTLDQLLANPEVAAAWRRVDPSVQRQSLGILKQNAKGDVPWTNERFKRDDELKGMAASSPIDFLEVDLAGEDLPISAKRALANTQREIMKVPEGDPRVARALQILGPDLNSAGISKRNNDRQFYQYVGALQDSITDFQKDNKRAPKAEEVQTIGRRLLQEQATGRPGWIGAATFGLINTEEKKRLFEHPAPEKDKEEIRKQLRVKVPGLEPNEDMIQRIYVREQFRKFYSGSPSSAKPTGNPSQPQPPQSR